MRAILDGNDITPYCQQIAWKPVLSRPAQARVRFPSQYVSYTEGVSELQITHDGATKFVGPIWYSEASGDADIAYTELTAWDHMLYLTKRMCKTGTGYVLPDPNPDHEPGPCNLADPTQVLEDEVTAPAIMAAFVQATIDCDPGAYQLFVGSVAGGGIDVTGLPVAWPMNIDQIREVLLQTGQLDVVITPGSGQSAISFYNGDYGSDLSGSISYDYGTGNFNAQVATLTVDMEDVLNALWYLMGPKRPEYPYDIQHWAGSITPTAPHQGGVWPPAVLARIALSRSNYGYMQWIDVKDTQGDARTIAAIRPLFEAQWANEAFLRAIPRNFASVKPERGVFPDFVPGDRIGVSAGSILGTPFSGVQRVYEFEVVQDANGVAEVTEMLTSADQE